MSAKTRWRTRNTRHRAHGVPTHEAPLQGKSPFQTVEVVQTKGHGKLLLIDGMTMVSERDEFVYHEMIAHVPLFLHPRPRRVLVIGGGDGGTVREVLRHKTVERCVLVEIDGLVVEASRRYLPLTAGKLSDRRAVIRIEDGVKFVRETDERFDVVIVDSTEPFGPAKSCSARPSTRTSSAF